MPARFAIRLAAEKTGLSTHIIRMWEKRYAAVSPDRTDSRRRLYSEEELERLRLLRAATAAGHRIGDVARLPDDELRALALPQAREGGSKATNSVMPRDLIADAVAAIRELNLASLEAVLESSALAFGQHGFVDRFVGPLAQEIGELWFSGSLTAAHEHFASNAIRTFLLQTSRPYAEEVNAPLLIAATPAGQLHELGAAMVAATARAMGWRVIYLGASLPAFEIAGAATKHDAAVVALSLVHPGDDASLPGEIELLRRLMPEKVAILVGGRAAKSYAPTLKAIGAIVMDSLAEVSGYLRRIRSPERT